MCLTFEGIPSYLNSAPPRSAFPHLFLFLRRYNGFSGRDSTTSRCRFPPPQIQRPREQSQRSTPVDAIPLKAQLRHLFGSESQSQESTVDLTGDEIAPVAPFAPATLPRPTLRYVVPSKDASAREGEKENAYGKPVANAGGRKRSRISKQKDPNQVTLSQAFGGGQARDHCGQRYDDETFVHVEGVDRRDETHAHDDSASARKVLRAVAPSHPIRRVVFGDVAKDVSHPSVLSEYFATLEKSAACAVGILTQDAVGSRRFGFRSNLRPVADVLEMEEARKAARDAAKPAPAPDGGWAAAVDLRLVAIGVIPLGAAVPDAGDGNGAAVFIFPVVDEPCTNGAPMLAPDAKRALERTLACGIPLVMHHAQCVVRWILSADIAVDASRMDVLDPRVMAWLTAPDDAHENGAERIAADVFGAFPDSTSAAEAAKAADASRMKIPVLERFRAELTLGASLVQRLRRDERVRRAPEATQREGRVAAALGALEDVGVEFDAAFAQGAMDALKRQITVLETHAAASLPGGRAINLASPHQVATVLFDELGLPPPSKNAMTGSKTGRLTTKDEVLQALAARPDAHELPGIVLRHRATLRAIAMCASYLSLGSKSRDGRLRCEWNNTRTATGRLSSSNPNLQAVGRGELELGTVGGGTSLNLRGAFVAPRGKVLLAADYSQIELRMLAHLSGDGKLAALLQMGGDVFQYIWNSGRNAPLNAPVSADERDRAKATVYGILYGQGVSGLAEKLGVGRDVARSLIATFFSTFPGVGAFVRRTREDAKRARAVSLPSGRHRPLPGFGSEKACERAEAERKAVNTLVQGSAADLMKTAMLRWLAAAAPQDVRDSEEKNGMFQIFTDDVRGVASRGGACGEIRLIAQIHDELLFEMDDDARRVEAAARAVRRCMEAAAPEITVPTPTKVSVGANWRDLRPLREWLAENKGCGEYEECRT